MKHFYLYYKTKIFLFYTVTILLPLTFSIFFWLEQSTNTLAEGFLIIFYTACTAIKYMLAILYFRRFIIVFNLTLQQCFLWLNWTMLKIFLNKFQVSLFHLHLKIYDNNNSLWRKNIRPSSSAPSTLYFSRGSFTKLKA